MENSNEAANAERVELLTIHRKNSMRSMVAVTVIMVVIFSVGIRAYIMAKSSSAGAFWPAVPMLLAVTFAYTGLSLKSMGKPLLIASLVVLCGAMIACLVAAITDGNEAESIHNLLWTSMAFNVFGIVACVISCSFLAGYVSLLNPQGNAKNPAVVLPHQYMAGQQPYILAQPNQSQPRGQMQITPSLPAGAMGDFRARLESRAPADRESIVYVNSII